MESPSLAEPTGNSSPLSSELQGKGDDISIGLFSASFDSFRGGELNNDSVPNNRHSLGSFNLSPIKVGYGRAPMHSMASDAWSYMGQPAPAAIDPIRTLAIFALLFKKFEYLLPSVLQSQTPHHHYYESDHDVAMRRINSALCAFGGTALESRRSSQSIFRVKHSSERDEYDRTIHERYHLNRDNKISWDFEENPPIVDESRHEELESSTGEQPTLTRYERPDPNAVDPSESFKYRCKVCGQLKQNHTCLFEKALQRSIGVMVYPAVNNFTADEPGQIAPPLTKMNNFVSYDSDKHDSPCAKAHGDTITVTPDSLKLQSLFPQTSIDTYERKRKFDDSSPASNKLFVASVHLRPEHYRAIDNSDHGMFRYAKIPLTFPERKRLSDSLFYLSKEIPNLAFECASALRVARQRNDWDQAVAELLVQVVIGLYCLEGDTRLDGLQQYLLALGVSC